jgi:hypothetical protein
MWERAEREGRSRRVEWWEGAFVVDGKVVLRHSVLLDVRGGREGEGSSVEAPNLMFDRSIGEKSRALI